MIRINIDLVEYKEPDSYSCLSKSVISLAGREVQV